ncbi:MAG: hypothetical protein ABIQ04_01090 [Candidatus Saccharimonadales bacterium]
MYENKLNDLRSTQLDIERRIANLGTASKEFYENTQSVMEIARDAPLTLLSSKIDKRRALMTLVLLNLTIYDEQLRWEYKKPFSLMAFYTDNDSWLGKRDSNDYCKLPPDLKVRRMVAWVRTVCKFNIVIQ